MDLPSRVSGRTDGRVIPQRNWEAGLPGEGTLWSEQEDGDDRNIVPLCHNSADAGLELLHLPRLAPCSFGEDDDAVTPIEALENLADWVTLLMGAVDPNRLEEVVQRREEPRVTREVVPGCHGMRLDDLPYR